MSAYDDLIEYVRMRCTECGDCWVWNRGVSHGSPVMSAVIDGKKAMRSVRRMILAAQGKDVGRRLAVAKCETALCVAPDHLGVMTRSSLTKRACERTGYSKRPSWRAKISMSRRKFTDEQVEQIVASKLSRRALAAAHGVSKGAIDAMFAGVSYKRYDGPFAALLLGAKGGK